jgi:hypothetical protein
VLGAAPLAGELALLAEAVGADEGAAAERAREVAARLVGVAWGARVRGLREGVREGVARALSI